MTDTTNTLPPLPERTAVDRHIPTGVVIYGHTDAAVLAYGDARAAHAVAQMQGEPVAQTVVVRCFCCGENSQVTFTPATAEQRANVVDASLAVANAACNARTASVDRADEWLAENAKPATAERPAEPISQDVMTQLQASLIIGQRDAAEALAATAPAPVAREITDAEIDVLLFEEIEFESGPDTGDWFTRGDLHQIVRAAIALANGRAET